MDDTKQYITRKALILFIKEGYHKVSMNDLVRTSGLSKGAFYHYFPSKKELFRETVLSLFTSVMEGVHYMPSKGVPLIENLRTLINMKALFFLNMQKHTGLSTIDSGYFSLLFQALRMFPDMAESLWAASIEENERLVQIFSFAEQNGELRDGVKPESLALMYAAMLDGKELHSVVRGDMEELHTIELHITEEFYQLIRKS